MPVNVDWVTKSRASDVSLHVYQPAVPLSDSPVLMRKKQREENSRAAVLVKIHHARLILLSYRHLSLASHILIVANSLQSCPDSTFMTVRA